MRIGIIHYHILPGGVTGVVAASIKALLLRGPEISEIRIICGRLDNTGKILDSIKKSVPGAEGKLSIDIIPQIDYAIGGNGEGATPEEIFRELDSRYSRKNWLFWVHNYQLGKNPAFTQAIIEFAKQRDQHRFLFQIHDFPECSRYENLEFLNKNISVNPYPVAKNIKYVLINERDRRLLVKSGIPETDAFLLHNPISFTSPAPCDSKDSAKTKLADAFAKDFPKFDRSANNLFYPVRTIRRKNVLEAALVTDILSGSQNLLVTLPGVSAQEKPFSDLVKQCYKEGVVQGLWGIGTDLENLGLGFCDVIAAADMVISSSVQEGFGYLFLNTLLWGYPLVARYLDILDGIKSVFEDYPHVFYNEILVPVDDALRKKDLEAYKRKIADLSSVIPQSSAQELESQFTAMFDDDFLDFSYLSPESQHTLLLKAKDPGILKAAADLNRKTLDAIETSFTQDAPDITDRAEGQFGFAAFAENFRNITASFDDNTPAEPESDVQRGLIKEFASKEYMRLLYEY
ncbi:MAG: hypothetical protein ACLFR1_15615 [Spirochaetia bacterium]